MGTGPRQGENRASTALATALKSPLLHKGELRARGRQVLVHVCGGPQMTFAEVQDLMKELGEHLHEEAQILFGAAVDASMGDELSLTVLTSLGSKAVKPMPVMHPRPAARKHLPRPPRPRWHSRGTRGRRRRRNGRPEGARGFVHPER